MNERREQWYKNLPGREQWTRDCIMATKKSISYFKSRLVENFDFNHTNIKFGKSVLEALKKQAPALTEQLWDEDLLMWRHSCPCCGEGIAYDWIYCPTCGQKLRKGKGK